MADCPHEWVEDKDRKEYRGNWVIEHYYCVHCPETKVRKWAS